jgi:hypothetical protein
MMQGRVFIKGGKRDKKSEVKYRGLKIEGVIR